MIFNGHVTPKERLEEGPRKPSVAVLDVTFDILFFRPIESMMNYQLVSLYVVAIIIE